MRLGAHESIDGGLARGVQRGAAVGADALQVFLKSSRQWGLRGLAPEDAAAFQSVRAEARIAPIMAHASYLANLASPDETIWRRSQAELVAQLERAAALRLDGLVLHPGAAMGAELDAALTRVAAGLTRVLAATPGVAVPILLETMAGQGTQVGFRFEQLGRILRATGDSPRLGVCFDTCHVFAAGYELRTPDGYEATLEAFEAQIGLARLHLLHLNDSEGGLGSRVDRHAHIGAGALGCDGFARLLNDSRLADLAGVLETDPAPDLQGHREDLARLRGLLSSTRDQQAQVQAL